MLVLSSRRLDMWTFNAGFLCTYARGLAGHDRAAAYKRPFSNACARVQDTLFADMAIYEYMAHEQLAITAWYVAKEFSDAFDVGMDAASKLAARFPDDKDKAENLAWFEKLREGLKPVH